MSLEFSGSNVLLEWEKERKKLEAFEEHDSSEKQSADHLHDTARISPGVLTQLQSKGSAMQPAAAAIWHLGSLTVIAKQKKKKMWCEFTNQKNTTNNKSALSPPLKVIFLNKFCCRHKWKWSLCAVHEHCTNARWNKPSQVTVKQ